MTLVSYQKRFYDIEVIKDLRGETEQLGLFLGGKMFENLVDLEKRYEDITNQLSNAEVVNNPEFIQKLNEKKAMIFCLLLKLS